MNQNEKNEQYLYDILVSKRLHKQILLIKDLNINIKNKNINTKKTQLDILQEQRDYKRRRKKYRHLMYILQKENQLKLQEI